MNAGLPGAGDPPGADDEELPVPADDAPVTGSGETAPGTASTADDGAPSDPPPADLPRADPPQAEAVRPPVAPLEVSDAEVDARFADLVAGLGETWRPPVGPWPVSEETDVSSGTPGAADLPAEPTGRHRDADTESVRPAPERAPLTGRDWEPAPEPAVRAEGLDPHEVWRPEGEPVRLPRDPWTALGLIGAIGGPIVLLLVVLAWPAAPTWVMTLAAVSFVGGFVSLILRLPRDEEPPPDDGAVL